MSGFTLRLASMDTLRVGDLADERAALFALLKSVGRGETWTYVANTVQQAGSAVRVLLNRQDPQAFPLEDDLEDQAQAGLFPDVDYPALLADARESLSDWQDQGLRLLTVLDSDYPKSLAGVYDLPPFLFYSGQLKQGEDAASVVGSRAASPQALSDAAAITRMLVRRGMGVVAGLAAGVDSVAHQTAIDSGGRTIAFMGTGIRRVYPLQNKALASSIVGRGGVVFSQFYPDQPPTRQTFPIRNASMSGYGRASIIVEASERSGTRIQARQAQAHGRPLILLRRVVESTSWGGRLACRHGVYVAEGVDEVEARLDRVLSLDRQLDSLLLSEAVPA